MGCEFESRADTSFKNDDKKVVGIFLPSVPTLDHPAVTQSWPRLVGSSAKQTVPTLSFRSKPSSSSIRAWNQSFLLVFARNFQA
jgi:hypothetical protein